MPAEREKSHMATAVIVDALRTPGGKRFGKLSGWHPADLAAEVLRALVDLNGTTRGSVPVGSRAFDIEVGYPAGAGAATITSVTVEVAVTGSNAWVSLPVSAGTGAGHYRAALRTKPFEAGRVMDLRVSATDAAGGILHQTTDRAFLIGN